MYSMLMAMHDMKEPYVKWSTEVLRHQQLVGAAEGLRVHVEVMICLYRVTFNEHFLISALGVLSRVRNHR